MVIKARKRIAMADCEQHTSFFKIPRSASSVIEYALVIGTLIHKQMERLERIHNKAMHTILGCKVMRDHLDFPTMEERTRICQAYAFLQVSATNAYHSPLKEIR